VTELIISKPDITTQDFSPCTVALRHVQTCDREHGGDILRLVIHRGEWSRHRRTCTTLFTCCEDRFVRSFHINIYTGELRLAVVAKMKYRCSGMFLDLQQHHKQPNTSRRADTDTMVQRDVGSRLFCCSHDGNVYIYDVNNFPTLLHVHSAHTEPVQCCLVVQQFMFTGSRVCAVLSVIYHFDNLF